MRPLPYKFSNGAQVLGAYKIAQVSGALAATPTALDAWARIRWPAPTVGGAKLVLCRLEAGLSVSGAVTTLIQFSLDAIIARGFTVDFDTAITNISMAGDTGKMHRNMRTSLMGTAGPGISTTTVMSGQTYNLDGAPFAIQDYPMITAVTATGTAIAGAVGVMSGMKDLYRWDGLGDHPPTLSDLEGIVVRCRLTGHATGTLALRTVWHWAEVINPFNND